MTPTPKNAGLTAPEGGEVYELFIKARSRPGVLGEIAALLGRYNLDILGGHLQVHNRDWGVITLYVDVSQPRDGLDKVLEELRGLDFTIEVDAKAMDEIFFEHFFFPITSGGHFRIFVISADAWMALEDTLHKTFGTAAATLLYHSGVALGKRVIDKMRERKTHVKLTEELLRANIIAMLRAYGIGIAKIEDTAQGFHVEISEPIMAEWDGKIIDYFTIGMMAGSLEAIYDTNLVARGVKYDSAKRVLSFELERKTA